MKRFTLLPLLFLIQNVIAQNIGVGITTPLQKLHIVAGLSGNILPFGPLVVESNNNTYINLLSPNDRETSVLFGTAGNAANGGIVYNNVDLLNGFQFRTNGNLTRMVIDQFGRVGIGVSTPAATLHVGGSAHIGGQLRTSQLSIAGSGDVSDFLIKTDPNGDIGFRKGYQGIGINYMIALVGDFPSTSPPLSHNNYIGEIRLFSGNNPPYGWAFCSGQILPVASYPALFAIIGTTYGGDGVNTFGLPDMRGKVPVQPGSNWVLGEISN